MTQQHRSTSFKSAQPRDERLAAYLASAGALGAVMASEAEAVIVFNTTEQPFAINGDVNIDFNSDGQIDFQIDHDRVDVNGTLLDYLQIDKNDVNGASNPLDFDPFENFAAVTFPPGDTVANDANQSAYVINTDFLGSYPAALTAGTEIGPNSFFDFQEGDNFDNSGDTIRANRLIDEDMTQIDQAIGGKAPDEVVVPFDGPNFIGLGGEIRYLGLRMDLNNDNNTDPEDPLGFRYGWIGVRIDNEADATGAVVGYAYETELGMPIMAGDTGPALLGDYNGDGAVNAADYTVWRDTLGSTTDLRADGDNSLTIDQPDYGVWQTAFGNPGSGAAAIPEPGSLFLTAIGGTAVLAAYVFRKWFL